MDKDWGLIICDLHGQSLEQAKASTMSFLNECIRKRIQKVEIITGKDGHGNEPVLMTEIPVYVESLGFKPEYPEFSVSGGKLEKGFFFVNLSHAVAHFEKQESDFDDSNRVLTQGIIEKLNQKKTAEQASTLAITVAESLIPTISEPLQKTAITPHVLWKINNITQSKDFKYKAELNDGTKTKLELFETIADLRLRLESGFKNLKQWENRLKEWETEEKKRESAKPKKKYHYKGHKT